jgi:hypothetical protein
MLTFKGILGSRKQTRFDHQIETAGPAVTTHAVSTDKNTESTWNWRDEVRGKTMGLIRLEFVALERYQLRKRFLLYPPNLFFSNISTGMG